MAPGIVGRLVGRRDGARPGLVAGFGQSRHRHERRVEWRRQLWKRVGQY